MYSTYQQFNQKSYMMTFNLVMIAMFVIWLFTANNTIRWIAAVMLIIKIATTFLSDRTLRKLT